MTNEQLDKLIALGVDLTVNGDCPFCVEFCNNDWCSYTKEDDERKDQKTKQERSNPKVR